MYSVLEDVDGTQQMRHLGHCLHLHQLLASCFCHVEGQVVKDQFVDQLECFQCSNPLSVKCCHQQG